MKRIYGEGIRLWRLLFMAALAVGLQSVQAQTMPDEYQHVLSVLGKKGDFKDNVLKVNIPRNDLEITVAGIATPTPFGFGGWLAMTKGDGGKDVMMGDLVLLEEEVNPVMSELLGHGLEVTALHNHFFWEQPRIFYMHVHGYGTAGDLAERVKPALARIGQKKTVTMEGGKPMEGTLDTSKLVSIVGHSGEQTGNVYKITIGRSDLHLKEIGAVINARMGLNTWAAFIGSNDKAAVAGDIAMLESEVTPVLKALREHELSVVAIHHHMTGSRPMIIFLHYWGTGPAEFLAKGFRAAIDELGKHPAGEMMHE